MSLTPLDLCVVGLYFVGMIAFAGLVRRRRSFSDFSVAERQVPPSIVFATLAATFIGPGYSLGLGGKGASSGFFFLLPFCMFSLQTVLVGWFLAPKLHALRDCHSLGDVMGRFYGPLGRALTGAVSVGLCLGFVAVMARAGGSVVASALGTSLVVGVALVTAVGMLYAVTGGLRAVIATEAVQFGILAITFAVLALIVANRVESLSVLNSEAFAATRATAAATPIGDVIALCVSFLLGETLIPPYANRALASDSAGASRIAFMAAGVFSLTWFVMMVSIGFAGSTLLPVGTIVESDTTIIAVAQHLLPSGLWGLFVVGIAAVVMSSQESVLNAGAVALVRDLIVPLRRGMAEDMQLKLAKLGTLVIGALGVVVALQAPSLIKGLLVCYSIWAPSVLPPLVWGLIGLPTNRASGVLALLGGAFGSGTGFLVYGLESVLPPLGLGFSLAAVGAVIGAIAFRNASEYGGAS